MNRPVLYPNQQQIGPYSSKAGNILASWWFNAIGIINFISFMNFLIIL